MNKLRDKIIKTFLRNDKSMRAQQFLFMSLLGTIAMIFGVVYTLSEGLGIRNVVALLFGAFLWEAFSGQVKSSMHMRFVHLSLL